MGRPRTLQPTTTGQKILDLVIEKYGSIQAAARRADVSEHTLRRRIYGEPRRIDLVVAERLAAIGIPRELLAS